LITTLRNLTKQTAHARHGHITAYNDIAMYFQRNSAANLKNDIIIIIITCPKSCNLSVLHDNAFIKRCS